MRNNALSLGRVSHITI